MFPRPSRRTLLIATSALAAIAAPAWAGGSGSSSGSGCNTCNTPPPPCDCTVPSTHQVRVPGVVITPPSVIINAPSGAFINSGVGQASSSSSAEAQANASSSTSVSVNGSSSASGVSQATALINAASYINGGGGGGGSWSGEGGVTTNIESVQVEQPTLTQRVCAQTQAVAKVFSVEAVCLDDKAVPHPASQVLPDHEIAGDFEGEVYRCIAGARMQYTLSVIGAGAGRTIACQKSEALYHSANGALACRPQKPARDCNERSLLRRYGAGIKLVKVMQAGVCVAWRNETVQAAAEPNGPIVLNGWR